MGASAPCAALVVLLALGCQLGSLAARMPDGSSMIRSNDLNKHKNKKRHPYTSPSNLFIQERASKQLPGPGQHFSFGSIKPWDEILPMLDGRPNRKLLFVVRHGQAVSNYLSDVLGPDEWFAVEGTCKYDDGNGTVYQLFDADLTKLGEDQAASLHAMLAEAGWFDKLTGGKPVRTVVSPLTRCLHTASVVMNGLRTNATNVEEFVRETLGEDTCDARRSVSDPDPDHPKELEGPCPYDQGLRSKHSNYKFRVVDADAYMADDNSIATSAGDGNRKDDRPIRPFGLISDEDTLWTKNKRERQGHQVRRARHFLDILFEHTPEQVVFIITHSGFTRSLLLAVRREPYRPQNAELVPVIVDKTEKGDDPDDDDDDDDDHYSDEADADERSSTEAQAGDGGQASKHVKHTCIFKQLHAGLERMKQVFSDMQQALAWAFGGGNAVPMA